jgi:hypothetical protein
MKRVKNILVILISLFCFIVADAAKVSMQVEMPRGKRGIGVGDTFWISVKLTDIDSKLSQPSNVPGAKLVYFSQTGRSSQSTIVNGNFSHTTSVTYTMTLKAEKEGNFKFGPLTVDGIKSNTVSYSIGKKDTSLSQSGGQSSSSQDDQNGPKFIGKGDDKLFLRANVSKTSVFEQEALVYTIKLYSSYAGVKFAGATSAPTFDGFVIEESKINTIQMDYETYNGKTYATAEIARYIIFPQTTGDLKVLGNTYTISVNSQEYYKDPDWGHLTINRPVNLNVKPNDLIVKVKPLPSPRPANFSGGVGEFEIKSELQNSKLKTNHAGSIVYSISGSGNLKYLKLPDLNNIFPSQLEVYSPSVKENISVNSNNTVGDISFDYSFMPLEEGEYAIPSVELVYFNPSTGKYETKQAKGYNVEVTKGEVSSKSQKKDRLVYNTKLEDVGVNKSSTKLIVDSLSYWLWYIVPILLLIIAISIYRRRINDLADIDLLKSKKANKVARKRLKKAEICLRAKDVDKFYDEILSAMWGYIGDKLRIPISDLNRENVRQKLGDAGVNSEDLDSLISLIDECEFAKYSSSLGQISMDNVYMHACDVINKLDNSLKSKVK